MELLVNNKYDLCFVRFGIVETNRGIFFIFSKFIYYKIIKFIKF